MREVQGQSRAASKQGAGLSERGDHAWGSLGVRGRDRTLEATWDLRGAAGGGAVLGRRGPGSERLREPGP